MTSRNTKMPEKNPARAPGKSRDAVETAIALAKRANKSTWEEPMNTKGGRFLQWQETTVVK